MFRSRDNASGPGCGVFDGLQGDKLVAGLILLGRWVMVR